MYSFGWHIEELFSMLQYFIPTEKQFSSVVNHYEDDDFIDRLNNRWTVRILVICIGVIMGNMFWNKQIQCWIPSTSI